MNKLLFKLRILEAILYPISPPCAVCTSSVRLVLHSGDARHRDMLALNRRIIERNEVEWKDVVLQDSVDLSSLDQIVDQTAQNATGLKIFYIFTVFFVLWILVVKLDAMSGLCPCHFEVKISHSTQLIRELFLPVELH